MQREELETRRNRSAAVFGNRYMAEVVAAVAALAPGAGTKVTTRMLANHTGLSDSLVRPVVKRLVEAGFLHPQDRHGPRSTNYHEVLHAGEAWEALVKICVLLHPEHERIQGDR